MEDSIKRIPKVKQYALHPPHCAPHCESYRVV